MRGFNATATRSTFECFERYAFPPNRFVERIARPRTKGGPCLKDLRWLATNNVAGAVTSVRLHCTQPSIGYNFGGGISADYGRLSIARIMWVCGILAIAILLICRGWRWAAVISIAAIWMIVTLLPYSFLTYMSRVPSLPGTLR